MFLIDVPKDDLPIASTTGQLLSVSWMEGKLRYTGINGEVNTCLEHIEVLPKWVEDGNCGDMLTPAWMICLAIAHGQCRPFTVPREPGDAELVLKRVIQFLLIHRPRVDLLLLLHMIIFIHLHLFCDLHLFLLLCLHELGLHCADPVRFRCSRIIGIILIESVQLGGPLSTALHLSVPFRRRLLRLGNWRLKRRWYGSLLSLATIIFIVVKVIKVVKVVIVNLPVDLLWLRSVVVHRHSHLLHLRSRLLQRIVGLLKLKVTTQHVELLDVVLLALPLHLIVGKSLLMQIRIQLECHLRIDAFKPRCKAVDVELGRRHGRPMHTLLIAVVLVLLHRVNTLFHRLRLHFTNQPTC